MVISVRIIMHIDVNNAFLSWSAIDLLNNGSKYDIRNSYAAIGGDVKARKGIVLAKSNSAKKHYIRQRKNVPLLEFMNLILNFIVKCLIICFLF